MPADRKRTRTLGPAAQTITMPPAAPRRPKTGVRSQAKTASVTYAGIGSRETPPHVREVMTELARTLANAGWSLRSGGADGADTAFADGARLADEPHKGGRTLYLPWPKYNDHSGPDTRVLSSAQQADAQKEISQHHPAWERCGQGARKLHGRNAAIILDTDLRSPVEAVICWTPNGARTGGTATAIRLAESRNIPVYNLARKPAHEIVREMRDAHEKPKVDGTQAPPEAQRVALAPPVRPVMPRSRDERERTPSIDPAR